MEISKYIKVDKNILIEYIYDSNNNISEPYKILFNNRTNTYSYVAGNSSVTNNTLSNQLFLLDSVTNNYGIVDLINYSYLQTKDYVSGVPILHDIVKIHLPVNYTFDQNIGCYLRVYTFDISNKIQFDISNFYFDISNLSQSYLLNYTSPPILFNAKLWGKHITLNIPSIHQLSQNNKPNSINYNLTNGLGLSLTSPIFLEFSFINTKKTINTISTYYTSNKYSVSFPQTPDFEKLGVIIQHSINGDFFEIFGTYNGTISEFNLFINNAINLGNNYYVTYLVTIYEQNIRGKSILFTVSDNFDEMIEYRPIIKYSTTTAIIDVEMNIIDSVDDSKIYRKTSYGMLSDEVSKYSLNLTKINVDNISKPKIYNVKNFDSGVTTNIINRKVILDAIKVNNMVLAYKSYIVAQSNNASLKDTIYYGNGNLQLLLYPFDNIIKIIIAESVTAPQNLNGLMPGTVTYLDLSNYGEIDFVIKNDKLNITLQPYLPSNEVDLANGILVFKISEFKMNTIKTISNSGTNVFYIVGVTDSATTVIYSGTFILFDSTDYINKLNNDANNAALNATNPQPPSILQDPDLTQSNSPDSTIQPLNFGTINVQNSIKSSNEAAVIIDGITHQINSDSSISIDSNNFTSQDIKSNLGLATTPTNLTIKNNALYTSGKFIGNLSDIKNKLLP